MHRLPFPVPLVALLISLTTFATTACAEAGASQAEPVAEIVVTAKRLDEARNGLSPETGSSVYRFGADDIAALPLGTDTPLNQVLLQSPGIAADSFGQLHVRGDHANLQYRINEIIIPEGVSGFGGVLDARFAQQINVLTGALPAQYGYRTAGIVDIHTKGANFADEGEASVLGGSHDHLEPAASIAGSAGAFSGFLTASYLQDSLGIENPTPARGAIHDDTRQLKAFGYGSLIAGSGSRISIIAGYSGGLFDIPDRPGLTPVFALAGAAAPASADLAARQREGTRFEILAYEATVGDNLNYQLAFFNRYSIVHYRPDPVGDLVYNGIAADILRSNDAYGVQGDASYRLGAAHTLRWGVFYSRERAATTNAATVFPADDTGAQTSSVPFVIEDGSSRIAALTGVYLQDEWQPVEKLTVNFGLRFDQVSAWVDERQWSPRLGIVYEWAPGTTLHAGYARYFTPPPTEKIELTSVEKFLNTTNALPSDANTAVTSERSNYYDIGVLHQLVPGLTVGLDSYYRQVKNLQDEGQFGNALIFSPFNFAEGRARGVELSSNWRRAGLQAYWNVAWSKAEGRGINSGQFNFDPAELDFIATHWVHLDHDQQWSSSAGFSADWRTVTWSLNGVFGTGLRRGFANADHLPAYLQLDAGARRTFRPAGIGTIAVSVSVLNLLDRTYELRDGSGIGVGAPQFGPRRAFYFGISKSW